MIGIGLGRGILPQLSDHLTVQLEVQDDEVGQQQERLFHAVRAVARLGHPEPAAREVLAVLFEPAGSMDNQDQRGGTYCACHKGTAGISASFR